MHHIYEYIDKHLIDKDIVDTDQLSKKQLFDLLDVLMSDDTGVRDTVLFEIQELLDMRAQQRKEDIDFEEGIRIVRLSNGDYDYKVDSSYREADPY